MGKEYDHIFLEVKVENIIKRVAFASFEALDRWTSGFKSKDDLVALTFKELKGRKIEYVKVRYNYTDRRTHKAVTKLLDVKYQSDKFNNERLKQSFKSYLDEHQGEIDNPIFGIVYYPIPQKIKDNLDLDYVFKTISYKTKRDIYFALRRLRLKEFKPSTRLQEMDPQGDKYLEYLQSLSLRDEATAMDELAIMYSLDEIPKVNIAGTERPLMDGTGYEVSEDVIDDNDGYQDDQVELTPEEIEELFKSLQPKTQDSLKRVREELHQELPSGRNQ